MTFATPDLELLNQPDEAAGELLMVRCARDLDFDCPRCKTPAMKACRLDSALYTNRVHIERRNEHDIGF